MDLVAVTFGIIAMLALFVAASAAFIGELRSIEYSFAISEREIKNRQLDNLRSRLELAANMLAHAESMDREHAAHLARLAKLGEYISEAQAKHNVLASRSAHA